MNKLTDKLIEDINSKKTKIKALGKVCGKIFRLEADDEKYLNITLGFLAGAVISTGLFIVKSIAASQNMLINGIEKSGNNYYLHGCCLDIHKKKPDMDELYEVLGEHHYDLNFLGNLNYNFENCFHKVTSQMPFDFRDYSYQREHVKLKQIATWVYNDSVMPNILLQKLYGNNYIIKLNSILDIIIVDKILIEHGVDNNFHSKLNEFIESNIHNGFSLDELYLLQKINYLPNINFST